MGKTIDIKILPNGLQLRLKTSMPEYKFTIIIYVIVFLSRLHIDF